MKRVRIDIARTGRPDIHDGCGGVHYHGDTPVLPDEVADAFVSNGWAAFVDGSSTVSAKKDHEARAAENRAAAAHARASASTDVYDSMPPEWRARVREEGDQVIEEYLATRPSVSFEQYEVSDVDPFTVANDEAMKHLIPDVPKRRGRPPGSKNKPKTEGGDA